MDVMEIRRGLLMQMAGINGKILELIGSYTVPTSWENDTDGNPVSITKTVLAQYVGGSTFDLYYLDFTNNNASTQNYKASCIVYGNVGSNFPADANFGSYGVCVRNDYSVVRPLTKSSSTWASSGTIINIYKMAK